jgi:hypothetical protein
LILSDSVPRFIRRVAVLERSADRLEFHVARRGVALRVGHIGELFQQAVAVGAGGSVAEDAAARVGGFGDSSSDGAAARAQWARVRARIRTADDDRAAQGLRIGVAGFGGRRGVIAGDGLGESAAGGGAGLRHRVRIGRRDCAGVRAADFVTGLMGIIAQAAGFRQSERTGRLGHRIALAGRTRDREVAADGVAGVGGGVGFAAAFGDGETAGSPPTEKNELSKINEPTERNRPIRYIFDRT